LFTVPHESLLEKGKGIRAIEESLKDGIEEGVLRERIDQLRPAI
jgi:hypothetical protein